MKEDFHRKEVRLKREKTIRQWRVWNTFTLKNKQKCIKNKHQCFRDGTYGYSSPRYFCGCEE